LNKIFSVGKRVQHIRKMKGLTQIEFAEKLSVSQSTISRLEKMKDKEFIDSTLNIISEIFDVDIDWLQTGSERIPVKAEEGQLSYEKKIKMEMGQMLNDTTQKVNLLIEQYHSVGKDSLVLKAVIEQIQIMQNLHKIIHDQENSIFP
jgi:transcriptional regulator with XRE-family HTH domain